MLNILNIATAKMKEHIKTKFNAKCIQISNYAKEYVFLGWVKTGKSEEGYIEPYIDWNNFSLNAFQRTFFIMLDVRILF